VKVSVFGLGYVGSVSAGCLSTFGHEIIGVDVNPVKVDMINAGQSPVIEANLDTLITKGVQAGRIGATSDAAGAILASDVSLICVGTPSAENGSLDLKYVKRVCQGIGRVIAKKDYYHVVVVRSTMLPGSTTGRIIPILEQAAGRKAGRDFGVCCNPEFLREGSAVDDFYHPSFTLIGEYDRQGAKIAAALYKDLDAPLCIVPLDAAEMVKYANNAFHALKVTFANEIGNICKKLGIDSHQVMDIFCLDEKLNLSPYYLKPGYAFGGSCLPKDLRALLNLSRHLDLDLPILESILPSNEQQVRIGFDMVRRTGKKKVGLLGFSFKAGTDDLRESPQVELIERLIGKGYQVRVYDRNVSLARLQGANRAYIEGEIPHIATLMVDSMDQVLAESEVIVIGNSSPEFCQVLQQMRPDQIAVDLVRIVDSPDLETIDYRGICW